VYDGRDDLKIAGRVDLLFLDGEGYPHIVDYKTSPKDFESYNSAKKLGCTY
jgi:ATP-dependent exoDNAse (exonuclease V) beta subunit